MTMGDNVSAYYDAMESEAAPKTPAASTRIPTPAELLAEPVIDYSDRVAARVDEVVTALRAAPRKPVKVRDDTPVIQGVADAMRAAGWSARTTLHRDGGKTGTVTVSAPEAIDPRLYR